MLHKEIINDFARAKHFFENITTYLVSPYSLNIMLKKNVDKFTLVDVRDYEDYIDGHIEYAEHIPYHKISEHFDMLDKTKPTIVYCYNSSCQRAAETALKLVENGYPASILDGGIETWEMFDFDLVRNSSVE